MNLRVQGVLLSESHVRTARRAARASLRGRIDSEDRTDGREFTRPIDWKSEQPCGAQAGVQDAPGFQRNACRSPQTSTLPNAERSQLLLPESLRLRKETREVCLAFRKCATRSSKEK